MRKIALFLALAASSGCVKAYRKFDRVMSQPSFLDKECSSWVGRDIREALATFGAPRSQYDNPPLKIYRFIVRDAVRPMLLEMAVQDVVIVAVAHDGIWSRR